MPGIQVWRAMVLKVRFMSGEVAWLLSQAFRSSGEEITIFTPRPSDSAPYNIRTRDLGIGPCILCNPTEPRAH